MLNMSAMPWLCGSSDFPPPISRAEHPAPRAGKRRPTVLVIDDEHVIADTVAHILHLSGFEATPVYSGRTALDRAGVDCPDLVITDVVMPDMNGIEIAKRLMANCPSTRVLLLSGQAASGEMLEQARADGYEFGLMAKPVHPEDLLAALHALGF